MLAHALEVDLDVFTDAHVGDLAKPERGEALLHGEALRVVDDRFGGDDHMRDHAGGLRVHHATIIARSSICEGTGAFPPTVGTPSGSASASGPPRLRAAASDPTPCPILTAKASRAPTACRTTRAPRLLRTRRRPSSASCRASAPRR